MRRLPIRLRLAIGFTAGAAVLLTAVGVFGYAMLARGFSHDLDLELRQRAQDLVGPLGSGLSLGQVAGRGYIERGESFAEVFTPSGRLIESTPTLDGRPLLSSDEAAAAGRGTLTLDRPDAPGLDEPARLLATPFARDGRPLVLVVGDTRENGLEQLRRVRHQLLMGLPVLLVVTFTGTYAVASAALRPVESMRRRAAGLSGAETELRLPVPDGDDEIARLGHTLNDLLARVEQTLERERSFVATAGHELRTPLALLRTELELALRRPRPVAELTDALRSAKAETDRLERLAEDLLLLAQAGQGELQAQAEAVSVSTLFAGVSARFEQPAAANGRRVHMTATDLTVRADRRQVEQALTNLVGNAFAHGGGVVRLDAVSVDGFVELVVADDGPGFGPDLLTRAMGRFVRGQASQGAGLGLAIVAAVADANDGTAGVRDVAGGAEAWLRLPAATSAAPSRV
jgi:two-component system OmpR family sensor kinase